MDEKIRIIIAEDDYLVCEEIVRSLRHLRYEILGEASNGEEAVKMVSSLKPDVVLMDIKMPVVDGLEASRQIQERCPTPIVILTAHETTDLLEEASKAGVGAYLTKPPKALEIERAVTISMARHHDLMEMRRLNQEIKTLRGILPICAFCKNIRNDKGYYEQIEEYIHKHSGVDFSHTVCPTCMDKHYPDLS